MPTAHRTAPRPTARQLRRWLAGLVVALAATTSGPLPAGHAAPPSERAAGASRPTIVLVHGAWADGSSWNAVAARLQRAGYRVVAPPNPLRGVAHDAETISDYVATLHGPVVLVGHSYGGMVISNVHQDNVRALVYVDAFIPDEGDTVFGINAARPGSCVAGDPTDFLDFAPYPGGPEGDVDAYLRVPAHGDYPGFDACFANGVTRKQAALLAVTQRPFAVSAGSEPSGAPSWRTVKSWAVIGTRDHVIVPAQQRAMVQRAHARSVEVRAGHLSLITRPGAVSRTIERAAARAH